MKYVSFLAMLILSACAASPLRQASPSNINNTSPARPSSFPKNSLPVQDSPIRKVDFNNFTYDWYPAEADAPTTGRKIILKDGSMNLHFGHGKDPREFYLIEDGVKYGDLSFIPFQMTRQRDCGFMRQVTARIMAITMPQLKMVNF